MPKTLHWSQYKYFQWQLNSVAAKLSDLFYQFTIMYKSADISNNFETFKPAWPKEKKKKLDNSQIHARKNKTQLM